MNTNIRKIFNDAINCNDCANIAELLPNSIPEPRWIGKKYFSSLSRIMLVLLNPGSGKGYKEYPQNTVDPLKQYKSGNITIEEYFLHQREDMKSWGHKEKFLNFYERGIELDFDSIAIANIAWCATINNKYKSNMLKNCFNRNTKELIKILKPNIIILSGTVTWKYKRKIEELDNKIRFVKTWHYANRKSTVANSEHTNRIKIELQKLI